MIESRQQPYNLRTKPVKSEGLDTRESTSPTFGDTNFIEKHLILAYGASPTDFIVSAANAYGIMEPNDRLVKTNW